MKHSAPAYHSGKDTVQHKKIINLFFRVKFVGGYNLHFTAHYRFTVIYEITIIWGDLMEICFTSGWFHTLGSPSHIVTTRGHSRRLTADTVMEVK